AMAQAAVALNFDQPADVHLHLLAEIAFHAALGFNRGAQPRHFLLGQVLDLFRRVDVRLFGERTRALLPDPVDGREAHPETLIRRKIHACDASHLLPPIDPPTHHGQLTLALAVLRIHADHAHHAAPMNDLALHADFLDRCPNLHLFDSVYLY